MLTTPTTPVPHSPTPWTPKDRTKPRTGLLHDVGVVVGSGPMTTSASAATLSMNAPFSSSSTSTFAPSATWNGSSTSAAAASITTRSPASSGSGSTTTNNANANANAALSSSTAVARMAHAHAPGASSSRLDASPRDFLAPTSPVPHHHDPRHSSPMSAPGTLPATAYAAFSSSSSSTSSTSRPGSAGSARLTPRERRSSAERLPPYHSRRSSVDGSPSSSSPPLSDSAPYASQQFQQQSQQPSSSRPNLLRSTSSLGKMSSIVENDTRDSSPSGSHSTSPTPPANTAATTHGTSTRPTHPPPESPPSAPHAMSESRTTPSLSRAQTVLSSSAPHRVTLASSESTSALTEQPSRDQHLFTRKQTANGNGSASYVNNAHDATQHYPQYAQHAQHYSQHAQQPPSASYATRNPLARSSRATSYAAEPMSAALPSSPRSATGWNAPHSARVGSSARATRPPTLSRVSSLASATSSAHVPKFAAIAHATMNLMRAAKGFEGGGLDSPSSAAATASTMTTAAPASTTDGHAGTAPLDPQRNGASLHRSFQDWGTTTTSASSTSASLPMPPSSSASTITSSVPSFDGGRPTLTRASSKADTAGLHHSGLFSSAAGHTLPTPPPTIGMTPSATAASSSLAPPPHSLASAAHDALVHQLRERIAELEFDLRHANAATAGAAAGNTATDRPGLAPSSGSHGTPSVSSSSPSHTVSQLHAEIVELRRQHQETLDDLRQAHKDKEYSQVALQRELAQLKEENARLLSTMQTDSAANDIDGKVLHLTAVLGEKNGLITLLQQQIDEQAAELGERIVTMEEERRVEKEESVRKLRAAQEELSTMGAQLALANEEAEKRIEVVRRQKEEEIGRLNVDLKTLLHERVKLMAEREQLQVLVTSLQGAAKSRAADDDLRRVLAQQSAQLEQLRADVQRAHAARQADAADVAQEQRQHDELVNELEERYRERIAALERDVQYSRACLSTEATKVSDLVSNMAQFQDALETVRLLEQNSLLSSFSSQLSKLRNEIQRIMLRVAEVSESHSASAAAAAVASAAMQAASRRSASPSREPRISPSASLRASLNAVLGSSSSTSSAARRILMRTPGVQPQVVSTPRMMSASDDDDSRVAMGEMNDGGGGAGDDEGDVGGDVADPSNSFSLDDRSRSRSRSRSASMSSASSSALTSSLVASPELHAIGSNASPATQPGIPYDVEEDDDEEQQRQRQQQQGHLEPLEHVHEREYDEHGGDISRVVVLDADASASASGTRGGTAHAAASRTPTQRSPFRSPAASPLDQRLSPSWTSAKGGASAAATRTTRSASPQAHAAPRSPSPSPALYCTPIAQQHQQHQQHSHRQYAHAHAHAILPTVDRDARLLFPSTSAAAFAPSTSFLAAPFDVIIARHIATPASLTRPRSRSPSSANDGTSAPRPISVVPIVPALSPIVSPALSRHFVGL